MMRMAKKETFRKKNCAVVLFGKTTKCRNMGTDERRSLVYSRCP